MPKTIINATNFTSRHDLEDYIKVEFGTEANGVKRVGLDIEVRGTKKQLKKFSLSDTSNLWGIKCVVSDNPLQKTLEAKLAEKGKTWK